MEDQAHQGPPELDANVNLYCGIDPGKTGAIAFIREDRSVESVWDMPVHMVGSRSVVSPSHLDMYFPASLDAERRIFTAVERQSARPSQGVVSVFSIGDSFGVARAVASLNSYGVVDIPPRTWQKKINRPSTGDSKADSLSMARELFPDYDGLARKKDHNRADALLIAVYARIMFRNRGGE